MFPDTCGIRLFLDPAVVVGQPFVADLLHHVAQQLDLRQQGVDVGLRDLEIGVVARFDVGALQQVEQPFFLRRVTGERLENLRRMFLGRIHQFRQIVALMAVENKGYRDRPQEIFGRLVKME